MGSAKHNIHSCQLRCGNANKEYNMGNQYRSTCNCYIVPGDIIST